MSRIGSNGGGAGSSQDLGAGLPGRDRFPQQGGDPFGRRDRRDASFKDSSGVSGRGERGQDADGARSSAFDRSIAGALRDGSGQAGDRDGSDGETREERVLALAERGEFDPLRPFAPPLAISPETVSAPDGAPARGLEPSGRAVEIAARVEEALRREDVLAGSRNLSLHLPLDGIVDGLRGVTIEMNPAGIDVRLDLTEAPSPELMAAAQVLADRLQVRFNRRVVRVLDGTGRERDAAEPDQGFGAISRLLGQPGG